MSSAGMRSRYVVWLIVEETISQFDLLEYFKVRRKGEKIWENQ